MSTFVSRRTGGRRRSRVCAHPRAAEKARALGLTSATEFLVGGVLKADLHPAGAHSLKWDILRADDFVLPPLPNHLFQRDNSCWIYQGVSVNPMAKPARQRETLHSRAIYRFHPMFAGRTSPGTTGTTTPTTCPPASKAATCMYSGTAR